jgi:hypothetical protein
VSCCALLLVAGISWAAEPAQPAPDGGGAGDGQTWSLKLPDDGKIVFSGVLEFDGASVGSNQMLYPAPNAAAFLASVITHGLIVKSQKDKQRRAAQERADQVLVPYRAVLDAITYQQLARAWSERAQSQDTRRLIGSGEAPVFDGWQIESQPAFAMAQDQRTLRLDALIAVRTPGATYKAVSQHHILVISADVGSDNPAEKWMEEEGRALRNVSAWLFAESIDIAMRAAIDDADAAKQPFRTIRYLDGKAEKMERAQLVSEHCGRAVIRTLRGALMSVPLKVQTTGAVEAQQASCAQG